MTKIVTEFGKFRYNCLSMGMCSSKDIFQAKLEELIGEIKGVKAYIYYIFFLSKDWFRKHIEHLRMIFRRLLAAGLKLNAPKCSFWFKDIPYLGYVITRDGIKPGPKKVQGVMYIEWPATTIEVYVLIGKIQYYRDMWHRWSHVLYHLIEADKGPKGRKILCNYAL